MRETEIENLEVELLLDAVYRRYGYDFRSYARASISRRARNFLAQTRCDHLSELIPRLMRDEQFFQGLAQTFSITVTEVFRDPEVYRSLRENVLPLLATYPFIKVWHAGCATGEEVYSMAILLEEAGLYDRATIFATDFNDRALEQAREGVYELKNVKQYTANYQRAGGERSFSEYYQASYDAMTIKRSLRRNITFANYNLVTDAVFGEMHLVLCRNVLIYFNRELQSRAIRLFADSLVGGGVLCLGDKESLRFSSDADRFDTIDAKHRLFRRRASLSTADR